ncbi:MAG: alpha/beta fold hydrolase [Bdellovibrionales bacterium]|nr:alpha/beta fold hydrolase [Bdellovibrionales bacterium]
MQVYQVENVEIKCRMLGSGPPVLLLHGFGGSINDWLPVAEILQAKYKLIIPNLANFYALKEKFTFNDQIRMLANLLDQLSVNGEKIHLVGTSYGGLLSFGLRFYRHQHLLSHTLINSMPLDPIKNIKNWRLRLVLYFANWPGVLSFYSLTSWGRRTFKYFAKIFHLGLRGKNEITHFNKRMFWTVFKALHRFLWIDHQHNWGLWKKIKIQDHIATFIVYSALDPLFSPSCYLKMGRHFNELAIEKIEKAGHLSIYTHPEIISQLLDLHFSKVSDRIDSENLLVG